MTIRPYLVEILGTPEAGKTTAIKKVNSSLTEKGYKVQYIQESAEIVPKQFEKGSGEANLWMGLNAAKNILAAKFEKCDIVLIDRGIIDFLFWATIHCKNGKITESQFYLSDELFKSFDVMPHLLIALTVAPYKAIERRGGEGRIVTKTFIEQYNRDFANFYNNIIIKAVKVDTTEMTPEEVQHFIESTVLENFNG